MSHLKRTKASTAATSSSSQVFLQGLDALSISLNPEQIERINQYVDLLMKWNQTYNLTAIKARDAVITHHILDSLTVLPYLQNFGTESLLDVGSGGGLPGLVIAICYPDIQVDMLDSNIKKTRFIQHVIHALALSNATSIHSRVEAFNNEQGYDSITSRAFSSLPDFVQLTRHLLRENGCWFAMKGQLPEDEINSLKAEYMVSSQTLKVPFMAEERHLIDIQLNKGL